MNEVSQEFMDNARLIIVDLQKKLNSFKHRLFNVDLQDGNLYHLWIFDMVTSPLLFHAFHLSMPVVEISMMSVAGGKTMGRVDSGEECDSTWVRCTEKNATWRTHCNAI